MKGLEHDLHDLCGLAIADTPLAWTGGSTYLHRKVPIYGPGNCKGSNGFNDATVGGVANQPVVARDGGYSLVRFRRSPRALQWTLP